MTTGRRKLKTHINQTFIARSIRAALLASAAISLSITTNLSAEESDEDEVTEEKITITGSRIKRTELSQPTPTVVVGAEELTRFGTSDLASALSELAAVAATDTLAGNSNSNASAGLSSANLRALGEQRTLTLVNGKRHVAGAPGSAQVDLTTIPVNLVERVEIVTGGTSAVYGSDAVTGVINVILKEDYEGFEVNLRGSTSTESVGNDSSNINILSGTGFGEGKGNVTFFLGREYTQEILSEDLQHLRSFGSIVNPDNTGEEDGIPDRLTVPYVGSEFINRFGVINAFFGPRYTFTEDGTPFLQTERDGTNSFAFGNFPNGCDTCFFGQDYVNILPSIEKINVGSTLNYELSDNVNFYSEFKFIRSDIEQQFQPSFRFGNIFINVAENPFLDEGLRTTLLNDGITSARFAKFFDELGNRSADNRRDVFRVVAGFDGQFEVGGTDFDFDTYYVNGRTNNRRLTLNSIIPGNVVAAFDAVIDPDTGEAACRSQVPTAQGAGYEDPASLNGNQCVPYNPFGFGVASEAARDFVSADVTRQDEIGQEYFGGSLVFDTSGFLNLPGGAIGVALGYEFREEFSETTTDELTKSGILANAATPDEFGRYDVNEAFIEFQFPILSGVTGFNELTIDAAYRTADYSHSGDADAWKIGLIYSPIEDLVIRGTVGEAVRAPSISEAFSPQSPGFANVNDPCDADNINDDDDRAANCAALGIPAGFQANDNVSINLISGGNPDLLEELSDSSTVGVVWTPSFLDGFSVTLDAYEIEITDAILFVAAQTVINNCVDATGGLDDNFCAQVDRDPVTNDITLVRSGFINGSAIKAEGIEADIRYSTDLTFAGLPGQLSSQLFLSQLRVLEIFEFQNRRDEINVEDGEVGDPEYQARLSMNYILDDLRVNWTSRFIDRSARFDVTPVDGGSEEDLSPAYVGSVTTHDISLSYDFSDDINVVFGIRNIGNKLAPAYTTNDLYDLIGRRAFAAATFNF